MKIKLSPFEVIKRYKESRNKCVNPFFDKHSVAFEELNTIANILNYHPEGRKFIDDWKTVCETKFSSYIMKTFLSENGIPLSVCLQAGINLFYAETNHKDTVDYSCTLSEHANKHSLRDFIYFAESYTVFVPK